MYLRGGGGTSISRGGGGPPSAPSDPFLIDCWCPFAPASARSARHRSFRSLQGVWPDPPSTLKPKY